MSAHPLPVSSSPGPWFRLAGLRRALAAIGAVLAARAFGLRAVATLRWPYVREPVLTVASKPGTGTVVTAAVPVTLLPIRPGAVYWPVVHHPSLDH